MVRSIIAATAPTMSTAISVVFETFTIEFKAPRVRAIAGLDLVLLVVARRRLNLDLVKYFSSDFLLLKR